MSRDASREKNWEENRVASKEWRTDLFYWLIKKHRRNVEAENAT